MLYLVIIALLVNMDSIVYFFEIPYQIIDMGGTQTVVSTLNIIHAIVYVFAAGISSSKYRVAEKNAFKQIKVLIICIASIYTITCFAPCIRWIYILVCLHGLLVGCFWSVFWSAFHKEKLQTDIKMSTLTVSSAFCSVIGPVIAGKLYLFYTRYVLLLFAGILFLMLFMEKALQKVCREWKERKKNVKQKTGIKKDIARMHREEEYIIRPEAEQREGIRMILLLWMGIVFAGYLEGIFRSAMAVYLLSHDIDADVWGTLQSVKLLTQTFTLIWIRYIGEKRFVFPKTKEHLLFGLLCWLVGSVILGNTIFLPLMIMAMILLGMGYGVVYFLCMTAGTSLTGFLNRNLNGMAECLTGAGILLGSALSIRIGETPYSLFGGMVMVGISIVFFLMKNNIWIKK